jgi:hypothetical protein
MPPLSDGYSARNQKGQIEWLAIWSCAESDQQWTSIKYNDDRLVRADLP